MSTPTPTPTPDKKDKKDKKKVARQRETTYAGKLGDWQRILAPLDANAADLPHLEIPRTQLAELLTKAVGMKKQQAASRATKQTASQELQATIVEGQRLAALLRQAVRQHYGPASPKLTELTPQVLNDIAPQATGTAGRLRRSGTGPRPRNAWHLRGRGPRSTAGCPPLARGPRAPGGGERHGLVTGRRRPPRSTRGTGRQSRRTGR